MSGPLSGAGCRCLGGRRDTALRHPRPRVRQGVNLVRAHISPTEPVVGAGFGAVTARVVPDVAAIDLDPSESPAHEPAARRLQDSHLPGARLRQVQRRARSIGAHEIDAAHVAAVRLIDMPHAPPGHARGGLWVLTRLGSSHDLPASQNPAQWPSAGEERDGDNDQNRDRDRHGSQRDQEHAAPVRCSHGRPLPRIHGRPVREGSRRTVRVAGAGTSPGAVAPRALEAVGLLGRVEPHGRRRRSPATMKFDQLSTRSTALTRQPGVRDPALTAGAPEGGGHDPMAARVRTGGAASGEE